MNKPEFTPRPYQSLAPMFFGMYAGEAYEKGICLSCKKEVDWDSLKEIDKKEYMISVLGPCCTAEIFD